MKVLVVEDNPGDVRLLQEVLREAGARTVQIAHVSRLGDALSRIEERDIDVVLLDLSLPDSRGLETVERIRAAAPDLPVVILTGSSDEGNAIEALGRGAQDYLVKGEVSARMLLRSLRYARERQRQIEEVARAHRDLRQVIDLAPEGIVILRDGKPLYVNRAFARSLGFPEEGRILTRSFTELVHPDSQAEVAPLVKDAEEGGLADAAPVTARFFCRAGDVVTLEILRGGSVQFEGEPATMLATRDVTERERLRARMVLSDRMATVGTMAGGVAHAINNPLASVLGFLSFVEDELLRLEPDVAPTPTTRARLARVREVLGRARDNADRVRSAVQNLMVFSGADAAKLVPVDVRRVLERVVALAENEVRHRARLRLSLAPIPPVEADEARLGQVFLNLLINAAQAIPEGKAGKNEISVATKTDQQGRIVVEVRDTGVGIRREIMDRIFDPFFTARPVGMATGLGLSISYGIVSSLGGEIEVESQVGRGSVFRVILPPTAKAVPIEEMPAASPPRAPRRASVLVVDDEEDLGVVLEMALPEHDVAWVQSGKEALERIRAGEHYDVVLTDLMMPNMTGMELHEEAVRTSPDLADRFVFMTGGAFTPRARDFLERVGRPWLQKPFDLGSLRDVVNAAVLGPSTPPQQGASSPS
ncbi:MAG: response regulator [Deltaproteobacteria bacterium]|nr:response regulator [Deltaproteobacteria bacterium]